jgi:hypothetical protein
MLRRILPFAFAFLVTCGNAADSVVYYGPNGKTLEPGVYQRVEVSWIGGQPVLTKTVLFTVGNVPPPPPPPPPPVTDVASTVAGFLSAVTDSDKPTMQTKLAKGYAATIQLADAGTISEAAALKTVQQMVDKQLVSKAAAAWKPWTDGMTALVAAMDFQATLAAYRIAQAQLGGGPVPPPPPPPPPPVTTAARAVILIESGDQTATQATLLNQMRNDKSWSKLVTVLDPDQKDENKQPDPQTQSLLQSLSGRPLPRLVLLNSEGGYVGDEPLPAKWDEAKTVLTAKGVKP